MNATMAVTSSIVPRLLRALLVLTLALVILSVAAVLAVATSGVFTVRPGAWTMPVRLSSGITLELNVSGVLRLATSPLGVRLLDGEAHTHALGHLSFKREGEALIVRCAPCRLTDPRLARATVGVPEIQLRLARRRGAEANTLLDGRLVSGTLRVDFVAQLAPEGITLEWALPDTPLVAVYRVLADAIPEARYARIDGRVRAHGRLALPSMRGSAETTMSEVEVGGLNTEPLRYGAFSFSCPAANGSPRTLTSGEGTPAWLDLPALGTLLPAAVLAAEDQRFLAHDGVDETELLQALREFDAGALDASEAPRLRGASTLTQQVARTLFTGNDRTAVRKLRELLYALEMERTLGKERILALYLNTVDWGPGLCGARAAARLYFDKRPAQLTPLEAAWLASILREPHAAHARQFLVGQPQTARARAVLMQMRSLPRRQREAAAQQALRFRPAAEAERGKRVAQSG